MSLGTYPEVSLREARALLAKGTNGRHPPSLNDQHCQFSGVPTKVGMAQTGHKTVAMYMCYVHTEGKPVHDAVELGHHKSAA